MLLPQSGEKESDDCNYMNQLGAVKLVLPSSAKDISTTSQRWRNLQVLSSLVQINNTNYVVGNFGDAKE